MPDGQKIVDSFHDDLDSLKENVDKTSEAVLKSISLDKILANPKEGLMAIATKYYEAHTEELKKSIELGKKEATQMVDRYVKTDKKRNI